jgi:hypothetical protein
MRTAILAPIFYLVTIGLFAIPAVAQAQTVNEVREALGDLQRWVESDPTRGNELWAGDGDKLVGWRDYLKVPQLHQALLLYPYGDRGALEFSLRQLEGKGDSLALPVPARLRTALKTLLAPHSKPELHRIEAGLRAALEQTPDVDPKQQLEAAKQDVAAAIGKTEALFAKWPQANQAGWREYLRWPLLKEELVAEHVPYSLRVRKIRRLLSRNHNGLERPEFRQLGESLRRLVDATVFYELHFPLVKASADEEEENPGGLPERVGSASVIVEEDDPDAEAVEEMPEEEPETPREGEIARIVVPPQTVYRQIVNSLLLRVSDGDRRGDGRQNSELNFDLTMGDQYPQLKQLVADIRKQLSHPSLHVAVTEAFVNELGTLPINQSMQVRETILGAQMSGTSRAVGTTSVHLTADPNRISADYLLNSRVFSNNTGVRGKIVARTTSEADVSGIIKANVDATGLTVGPPRISADTDTHIDSVRANTLILPNLISRIATRAAHKQLPRAQEEASRKTEQRISQEFSKQAGERVARINQIFREKITPFLERRGDIKGLQFSSTDSSAHGSGRITDVWQVSTDSVPPPHGLSGPVIVRVHESLINNWLETELAGNILQVTGSSFEYAEDLGLEGPNREECPEDIEIEREREKASADKEENEPQENPDAEQTDDSATDSTDGLVEEKPIPGTLPPNSIRLANRCPIALSFDNDKIRVHAVIDHVNGAELKKQIDSPLEVSAVYRISRSPGTIALERIGRIEVNFFDPVKNNRYTSVEFAAKSMLQRRVSYKVLRCRFNVTRIVDRFMDRLLSKNTQLAKLRDYEVTNVQSEQGWLTLSLNRKASPVVQQTGTPTLAPVIVQPAAVAPAKVSP